MEPVASQKAKPEQINDGAHPRRHTRRIRTDDLPDLTATRSAIVLARPRCPFRFRRNHIRESRSNLYKFLARLAAGVSSASAKRLSLVGIQCAYQRSVVLGSE